MPRLPREPTSSTAGHYRPLRKYSPRHAYKIDLSASEFDEIFLLKDTGLYPVGWEERDIIRDLLRIGYRLAVENPAQFAIRTKFYRQAQLRINRIVQRALEIEAKELAEENAKAEAEDMIATAAGGGIAA